MPPLMAPVQPTWKEKPEAASEGESGVKPEGGEN
jgi:hypothetical protein